jgi:hypothetical protein
LESMTDSWPEYGQTANEHSTTTMQYASVATRRASLGRPQGDGSVSDGTRVGNSVGVPDGLGLGDLVVGASVGVHVDVPAAAVSRVMCS